MLLGLRVFSKKKESLGNVLSLLTGTTIAQLIPVIISPIITRMYSPVEFGIFTLYMTLASLGGVIATGRYELAIVLPKSNKDAINLFLLSLLIALFLSVGTLFTVSLFNVQIASFLNTNSIAPLLYLLPLSVMFAGIYQSLNYWSNRNKKFAVIATSRVSQSITTGTSNILLGFSNLGGFGLIVSTLLGQVMSICILGRKFLKDDFPQLKAFSKRIMSENAKKYKDFPTINSLHAFVDMLQSSGILFVISIFFGSVTLGLYSLALRIIQTPLTLISSSVAQVFYQRATQIHQNTGDLYAYVKKMILVLSAIGFIVVFVLFFSPQIFALVFGEEWRESGIIARILSAWVFIKLIVSPISQIPIILGRQKTSFIMTALFNVLLFVVLYSVSYAAEDIYVTLSVLSGLTFIYHVFYGYWIITLVKSIKGKN